MTNNVFLRYSLLIFIVFSGNCTSYKKIDLSESNAEFLLSLQESALDSTDLVSRVEIGKLYFFHNRFDEAKQALSGIYEKDSTMTEALAWLGATNAKIADRSFPWFMGIRKLYLVKKGFKQVDVALKQSPENFDVNIIAIRTGFEANMLGSVKKYEPLFNKLFTSIDDEELNYTDDAKANILLCALFLSLTKDDLEKAQKHIASIKEIKNIDEITLRITNELEDKIKAN